MQVAVVDPTVGSTDIPSEVAVPRMVDKPVRVPVIVSGEFIEETPYYPIYLGHRTVDGRIFAYLTKEFLTETVRIDPTKPVDVRLRGDWEWLPAMIHAPRELLRRRVGIRRDKQAIMGITGDQVWDAQFRGNLLEAISWRTEMRPVPQIIVTHLGQEHYAEQKPDGTWNWMIPDLVLYQPPGYREPLEIEPYIILKPAFDRGLPVEIEFEYLEDGRVIAEIGIGRGLEKDVAKINGYAYRNIANRNYILSDTHFTELSRQGKEYPFFCELRSSYLTAYPRLTIPEYHNRFSINVHPNQLIDMLGTTNWNMIQYIFVKRPMDERTGQTDLIQYLAFPENTGKLVSNAFSFKPRYKGTVYTSDTLKTPKGAIAPREVTTPGEQINQKISEGMEINETVSILEFDTYPFNYCIKYARFINANFGYYVYNNRWIEDELKRTNVGLRSRGQRVEAETGPKGFIWET